MHQFHIEIRSLRLLKIGCYVPFVYMAAAAFQTKRSSCMFGKEKNRIYYSWAPPFTVFVMQGWSKQLPAAFVATVLQHSKQWRALQKHKGRIQPALPLLLRLLLLLLLLHHVSTILQREQWRHGLPFPFLLFLFLFLFLLLLLHYIYIIYFHRRIFIYLFIFITCLVINF